MNQELTEALFRDFPDLYCGRNEPVTENLMSYGFDCGDGWHKIIRELSEQLTFLAKAEDFPVKAIQVKEKFGGLRFYEEGVTPIMRACIELAESESLRICEICGNHGALRSKPWLKTLCDKHAYDLKYPISEAEAEKLGVTDHVKVKDGQA